MIDALYGNHSFLVEYLVNGEKGELLARVHEHEDSRGGVGVATPSTRIVSEVDIPSRDLHTHEERVQRRRYGGPIVQRPNTHTLNVTKKKNILSIYLFFISYKEGIEFLETN